jgi:hypothetical protein
MAYSMGAETVEIEEDEKETVPNPISTRAVPTHMPLTERMDSETLLQLKDSLLEYVEHRALPLLEGFDWPEWIAFLDSCEQ